MSPEQAQGRTLDHRSDLFSLGSVLYQMASGRAPFRAATAYAVLKRVSDETPRPIREIIPEVPEWLCTIITALHAKSPHERLQSAQEVAELLRLQRASRPVARDPEHGETGDAPHISHPLSRIGWRKVAAIAVMLLITFTMIVSTWENWRSKPSTRDTRAQGSGDIQQSTFDSQREWYGWPADAPSPAIAPFNSQLAAQHQENWAKYLDVPVEYTNSIGMKFRLIPPGEFTMGSTASEIEAAKPRLYILYDALRADRAQAEGPQRRVVLTQPFFLGVHEITQHQYAQITGTNPSASSQEGTGVARVRGSTSDVPVEMLTWVDAARFCELLQVFDYNRTAAESADPSVTAGLDSGYRLPRESEWEFACRAGTTTRYWCGDDEELLVNSAWYAGNNTSNSPKPVGQLAANPFGLFDVHGNVWEWVDDGWDPLFYQRMGNATAVDPHSETPIDERRVIRGGDYFMSSAECRSSCRDGYYAGAVFDDVGFRVTLSVELVRQFTQSADQANPSVERPDSAEERVNTTSLGPPLANAPFDAPQASQHQQAWASYLNVPVEYTNSIGMKLRLIPPGEFTMGMAREEVDAIMKTIPDEDYWRAMARSAAPLHRVRITQAYYMGSCEVTQEQYEKVVGSNPSYFSSQGDGKDAVEGSNTSLHPVDQVSLVDAVDFCIKLSGHEDLQPAYLNSGDVIVRVDGDGYRLPTEAEWEWACRAGTTAPWYVGTVPSKIETVAWLDGNSGSMTHPVAELQSNPFGMYDMHGNVWEWCQDWYHSFTYGQRTAGTSENPQGPAGGTTGIVRGGSRVCNPDLCRSAVRSAEEIEIRHHHHGFRIVAAPSIAKSPD